MHSARRNTDFAFAKNGTLKMQGMLSLCRFPGHPNAQSPSSETQEYDVCRFVVELCQAFDASLVQVLGPCPSLRVQDFVWYLGCITVALLQVQRIRLQVTGFKGLLVSF